MSLGPASQPKRNPEIETQRMPDGSAILLDSGGAAAHPLNESAAKIWDLADGSRSVNQIVDELLEQYEVERAAAQSDVLRLVEDLVGKGILQV